MFKNPFSSSASTQTLASNPLSSISNPSAPLSKPSNPWLTTRGHQKMQDFLTNKLEGTWLGQPSDFLDRAGQKLERFGGWLGGKGKALDSVFHNRATNNAGEVLGGLGKGIAGDGLVGLGWVSDKAGKSMRGLSLARQHMRNGITRPSNIIGGSLFDIVAGTGRSMARNNASLLTMPLAVPAYMAEGATRAGIAVGKGAYGIAQAALKNPVGRWAVGAAALTGGLGFGAASSAVKEIENTYPYSGEAASTLASLADVPGLGGLALGAMAYMGSRDKSSDLAGVDYLKGISTGSSGAADGPMNFSGMGGGRVGYGMGASGDLTLSLSKLRRGR